MKNFKRILMFTLTLTLLFSTALACEGCGYVDINPYVDVLPATDQLQAEAYLLGDALIGRTVHVLRSGPVRSGPNQSSRILTEVFPDDKVAILDYAMESVNPLAMWLKIDFYGMEGWISASRGKIVSCAADKYTFGNNPELEAMRNRYVGQTMMVNLRSGNARAGAGSNYPIIEYVHLYETYRIQAAEYDSEGKLWFMIRIGSRECWVRNTLMDYISN